MSRTNVQFGILVALLIIGAVYHYSAPPPKAQETPQVSDAVIQSVQDRIAGTWKFPDDPAFTREIREGGGVIDRYKKPATTTVQTGEWRLFTQVRLPPDLATINALPIRSDTLYLQFVFGSTAFNFSVIGLSDGSLTLGYLDRTGTTVLEKVEQSAQGPQ